MNFIAKSVDGKRIEFDISRDSIKHLNAEGMSRIDFYDGSNTSVFTDSIKVDLRTKSEINLKELLAHIKNATTPIEEHTDPKAVDDCWQEIFEFFESFETTQRGAMKNAFSDH